MLVDMAVELMQWWNSIKLGTHYLDGVEVRLHLLESIFHLT